MLLRQRLEDAGLSVNSCSAASASVTIHPLVPAGVQQRVGRLPVDAGAVPAVLVLQVIRASQFHQTLRFQVVC